MTTPRPSVILLRCEENGWAAHHLNAKEKEIVRFAKLEQEAGEQFMRSLYKFASYNVHASPKGVYFKLGRPRFKLRRDAPPKEIACTGPNNDPSVRASRATTSFLDMS